ncbi:cupin domain-containing protein [Paraburkholderia dinghuensis]|uniref:Cupin domain-containing protein n=1 Tax=Paraburkholderia dinghuensis TaxID=2305225 RepID=A0A3N6N1L5_9BURK|nr:cupin domain-containing protein [Paraburkholderia dinghuensis]RQH04391.1 cupin domain-containing protein [Paraburkholderia dinghuensis]
MNSEPFVVTPGEYPRALNVVGEKITVLASRETARGYEIFLQQGPEGSGPPPHSHVWDETFYVIKGSVEVVCNGVATTGTPGTLVHVPGGTVHSFAMGADGCEMLSVSGPVSEAAALFTMIDAQVPPGEPDIPKLMEIAAKCNVRVGA